MPESNWTGFVSETVDVAECGCWPVLVQVTVVPGGTMIVPGEKAKSTICTLLTETALAWTSELGGGGAGTGSSVPSSEKTQRLSPRGKLSWKLPPEATATYCLPSIS